MPGFVNRARMTTATTGTGTITLGSAVTGFQTFAAAGVQNGDIVTYVIEDGSAWEIGEGTYTTTGTTLSRTLVASSTGSLLTLSGTAQVFVSVRASEIVPPSAVLTTPSISTAIYGGPLSSFNNIGISNNNLCCAPFIVDRRRTFTRIGVRTGTVGVTATNVRLGIYAERAAGGLPGRLVLDAGVVAIGTATQTNLEATISQVLEPGRYFTAAVFQSATTVHTISTPSIPMSFASGTTFSPVLNVNRAFTYGALPTDESAATYTLNVSSSVAPVVFLRIV